MNPADVPREIRAFFDAWKYLREQPLTPVKNYDKSRSIRGTVANGLLQICHQMMATPAGLLHVSEWTAKLVAITRDKGTSDPVLLELIAQHNERGEKLPSPLEDYLNHDILRDMTPPRTRRKPGENPEKTEGRDLVLCHLVSWLQQEYGLRPTRNEASRDLELRLSGCAIVAAAIRANGLNMTEVNVERIWKGRPSRWSEYD